MSAAIVAALAIAAVLTLLWLLATAEADRDYWRDQAQRFGSPLDEERRWSA